MNRIFGLLLAALPGCATSIVKPMRDVQMAGDQGRYKVIKGNCENHQQLAQQIRQDLQQLCGGRSYTITSHLIPVFPCYDWGYSVDIAFTCEKNNTKRKK